MHAGIGDATARRWRIGPPVPLSEASLPPRVPYQDPTPALRADYVASYGLDITFWSGDTAFDHEAHRRYRLVPGNSTSLALLSAANNVNSVLGPPFLLQPARPDSLIGLTVDTLRAVERLRSVRQWQENWDGERACAPERRLLDAAERLVVLLNHCKGRLRVLLDALGRPMVLLSTPAAEAEITVTEPRLLDFAVATEGVDDAEADVIFDGKKLPDRLIAALIFVGFAFA